MAIHIKYNGKAPEPNLVKTEFRAIMDSMNIPLTEIVPQVSSDAYFLGSFPWNDKWSTADAFHALYSRQSANRRQANTSELFDIMRVREIDASLSFTSPGKTRASGLTSAPVQFNEQPSASNLRFIRDIAHGLRQRLPIEELAIGYLPRGDKKMHYERIRA